MSGKSSSAISNVYNFSSKLPVTIFAPVTAFPKMWTLAMMLRVPGCSQNSIKSKKMLNLLNYF
jgi:hypothetical protein